MEPIATEDTIFVLLRNFLCDFHVTYNNGAKSQNELAPILSSSLPTHLSVLMWPI